MNNEERINNLENQINILSNKFKENNERYLNLEREIHNLKEYNQKTNTDMSNKIDTLIGIIGKNSNENNKGTLNNPNNPFIKASKEEEDNIGDEEENGEEMDLESSLNIKSRSSNSINNIKVKKKYNPTR